VLKVISENPKTYRGIKVMDRVTKMSTKWVLDPASQSIFFVEWCTEWKPYK
jgi:hypothetical protein